MDKKTLLAIVLSSAVLILYYGFIYRPPPPPPSPEATQGAPATPGPVPQAAAPAAETQAEAIPAEGEANIPVVDSDLSSDLVQALISSKGGFPVQWLLKKFFQEADDKGGHIDLFKARGDVPPLGLLLLPGQTVYYPAYELAQKEPKRLLYQGKLQGLELQQAVELGPEAYALGVSLKLRNTAPNPLNLSPGIRIKLPQPQEKSGGGFLKRGAPLHQLDPLYRIGTKVTRERNVKKLGTFQEQSGDISWVGLEDRYFLRAILARSVSGQNSVAYGIKDQWIFSDFRYPPLTLAPGEEKEFQFTLYLGPKDPTYLNQFAQLELDKAIDYGWFGLVARPILQVMKFFQGFLGNWGLAIILLTVLIKVLLYPLTRKSMASMKAMQALQPQLKAIREKYKEDKERLNMETMNLFRRHKVNPMGGCLPMVIQMPIYIALYKVLYNATELYHAPFFWFYRDLSAPDPYYIMPVLLGVAMVAQQKMTPSTTGDATQQKMMMLMPILFTVFMLFLPVGLVLYIFVNTVMTVVQQYMHQHDISVLELLKGRKSVSKV